MSDLIRREDAIETIHNYWKKRLDTLPTKESEYGEVYADIQQMDKILEHNKALCNFIKAIPSADRPQGWIPCSERLPEDIRPVLVTWKNNDPKSYYQYIVGKHFIGTAHYHRGKWYWYSSVTEDLLAEYGKCDSEEFDEAIEAVAWMPLPKPWKGADDE